MTHNSVEYPVISSALKGFGELCLLEFDRNLNKYIAVAWLDDKIFTDFASFSVIKTNLEKIGASEISINVKVECDINEIIAGVAKDGGKETEIYFKWSE
jgi:hypothetical protein